MSKPPIVSGILLFALACGPETGEQNDIPGKLEYEELYNRVYRDDHRIDVIQALPGDDSEHRECGFLTDRGYNDLDGTLEALDPSADYGEHPADCDTHGALVYIEGFEHSPFDCSYECCHADLLWAAVVYSMVLNNFDGITPTIGIAGGEGEPYVAIDPDRPCP